MYWTHYRVLKVDYVDCITGFIQKCGTPLNKELSKVIFDAVLQHMDQICTPSSPFRNGLSANYLNRFLLLSKFHVSFRNCRRWSLPPREGAFPETIPARVQQSPVHHYCLGWNERPFGAPWQQRIRLHHRLGLLRLPPVGGVFSAKDRRPVPGQWTASASNCHVKVAWWFAWLYLQ